MSSPAVTTIKALIPAALHRWVRRRLRGAVFIGDFPSWAAARAASDGYDDLAIFEKALASVRQVRDGTAAWERDTVLFHEPFCHRPLLDALRSAAAAAGGRLNLVDFGGALGSTWWQHRAWLTDLNEVRWSVVDQPRYVEAGMREFSRAALRFYRSLDECWVAERPTVMLLSSVLPYLETPHALLEDIAGRGLRHVIIDRTGFVTRGHDRLTVQRVPAAIYRASYPCWFFDRPKLLRPFARGWRIVAEWPAFDKADINAEYAGLMLENEAQ